MGVVLVDDQKVARVLGHDVGESELADDPGGCRTISDGSAGSGGSGDVRPPGNGLAALLRPESGLGAGPAARGAGSRRLGSRPARISERSITPRTRVRARSMARRIRGKNDCESRNRTSVLAGWTLTSTSPERNVDEKERLGRKPFFQKSGEGLVEGGGKDFVLDRAPVDEKDLAASVRPAVRRTRGEARNAERAVGQIHLHQLVQDVLPVELIQPLPEALDGRAVQDGPLAVADGQAQAGMGQGDVRSAS